MATLLEIENRVKALEGHRNDDSDELRESIRSDINDRYQSLSAEEPMYWLKRTDSLTPQSGGLTMFLATDTSFLLSITAPGDTKPMESRDRDQQLFYQSGIDSAGIKTYSIEGYDTARPVVHFYPAAPESAHSVRVTYIPAAMSADTDEPIGPDPFITNYLIWSTFAMRLLGDEERDTLMDQAEGRAQSYRRQLVSHGHRIAHGILVRPQPRAMIG